MKLKEWMATHKQDPGELCAPPMNIDDAMSILVDELLGEGWYITYSGNTEQCTAEIVAALVEKYGKKK